MLFNPLFIQPAGSTDTSSSIKQSKFNSPTYLFSDIIKIINKNTIGETSVTPTADSVASANVAEVNAASSEPMGQLLTLAGDESATDNINISLNDLLKNLLISSDTGQVKNSGQVDSSSKKSIAPGKLTSVLSKTDMEKLLQSLAASLLKLNISPDSLQQILSGNSGPDLTSKDNGDLSKSLNSLSQAGNNTIAELVINLSKDSKTTETSKDSTANQSDALTSLYKAISSMLAGITNNASSEDTGKTLKNNSKNDSSDQKISTGAEQLAAALMNLYQNNNSLVINVNSGDNTIKIEISNGKADSVQANKVDSGNIN